MPGHSEKGDGFGSALAAGDFDDDGYSDLAIGIPFKDVTSRNSLGFEFTAKNAGGVVVIYGSQNGLTATDPSVRAPTFYSRASMGDVGDEDRLGLALSWGDFNGDGVADLAIGIPNYTFRVNEDVLRQVKSEAGAVWILNGKRNIGLTFLGNHLWRQHDLRHLATERGERYLFSHFGRSLTSGDFNGDGYSDLAIGAPDQDEGIDCVLASFTSSCIYNFGEVDVMYGSSIGLSPDAGVEVIAQGYDFPSHHYSGTRESDDHFGAALAAGDFNGDGKSDLAVGIPGQHIGAAQNAGAVQVIYGSTDGLKPQPGQAAPVGDQILTQAQSEEGDQLGLALAAGDFNGDGRADLAIGVPFEDVIVTRNGTPVTVVDAGEVDVIYGSASGLSDTVRAQQVWTQGTNGILDSANTGDQFGSSLTAWNFGRNDLVNPGHPITVFTADLAIGVPNEDLAGLSNAGVVHVIYGSAVAGLTSTNNQIWTQGSLGLGTPQTGDRFGAAVY